MSKLTQDERSFLALVQRSPDHGDGWRSVSAMLWEIVAAFKRQELIESELFPDGTGRVRLTPEGETVIKYL